ncbi:UDP-N-acetylmuramoyl-L-alanine--D-glutamate ligase [Candidatus Roizmanbacteria bacterium]|nr:UDP-N-acetylmuramoyl-L-alanine--D-glutamate ligase [Candidatus Roizmanbacteria bacterium]
MMNDDSFSGKKVLVMGLGILGGGIGTTEFFCERGAHVTVTDLRNREDLQIGISQLSKYPIQYVLGEHREEDFQTADIVIRNPGVPLDSPYLQIARDHHVPIEMAESLFLKLSPTKQLVGVTGTRGKSTTSALIHRVLKSAGKDSHLAGNQKGTSTLQLLNTISKDSIVVLELSSWQLESFGWHRISPHIAVVTNLYPDHLNRYRSIEEYAEAKENIFKYQNKDDYLVLNKNNEQSRKFAEKAKSKVWWFSADHWYSDLFPLKIPGEHNRENAAAASTVGLILDIDPDIFTSAISSFTGLAGRLEHIKTFNGVTIINDTTSTTPAAGIAALNSFPEKKTVVIVGGTSKNLPTNDLVETIKKRAKAIVLLDGKGTEEIRPLLSDLSIPVVGPYVLLPDAVQAGLRFADSGDILLFSPSFPSFAHFKNEFERGEAFTHAVQKINTTKGKITHS